MRQLSSFQGKNVQHHRDQSSRKCKCHCTIKQYQQMLKNKEIKPSEITEKHLKLVSKYDPQVQAFLHVCAEEARNQAAIQDKQQAAGEALGPLAGIPIGIKDSLCTKDIPTTAGSKSLAHYTPPYTATSVSKLQDAGGVVLGKVNMDEFAMGSTTESSAAYVTRNPWSLTRVPGGSSGGSAACVAAQQVPVSLGSDTGGSIRLPASHCGVVGLKPTYGAVSRYGLIAFASSLEVVGPMGRTVDDVATLMQIIAGSDPSDSSSSTPPQGHDQFVQSIAASTQLQGDKPLSGFKFGVIRECMGGGVDADVAKAIKDACVVLEGLGAVVEEVSIPLMSTVLPAYYIQALAEASSNLARYDGIRYGTRLSGEAVQGVMRHTRGEGLGPEVKRRIMLGTYALSAGYYDQVYGKSQRVRTLLKRELSSILTNYTALLSPVAPTVAPRLNTTVKDPLEMYKGDVMTVAANLAGFPAISVPAGFKEEAGEKLPIGLQIVGGAWREGTLLTISKAYESASSWHDSVPALVGDG